MLHPTSTLPFRCGVCRKELHGIFALLSRRPFPVCSRCRLMVHRHCLAEADPPVCSRCSQARPPDANAPHPD